MELGGTRAYFGSVVNQPLSEEYRGCMRDEGEAMLVADNKHIPALTDQALHGIIELPVFEGSKSHACGLDATVGAEEGIFEGRESWKAMAVTE